MGQVQSRISDAIYLYNSSDAFNVEKMELLIKTIVKKFQDGQKIAFVGNGGSAAEAMHLAAEFTGRCVIDHPPLPAICLNESQSALTAIANDYGTEAMYSRAVQAHLKRGDLLIGLSTSGKSENILNALRAGEQQGVDCHLWMGDFDSPDTKADIWKVPSKSTPRIQEIHLTWGHIIAEVVEIEFSFR
jgi:D-sedoheptulose 7-phosphate isomerase